jgi:hypothetical protein
MKILNAFFKMFKDDTINEIKNRYAEIIIDSVNTSRPQRILEGASLYQLPAKCKCGFFGKNSTEMETHFDECKIYSSTIINLTNKNNLNN